MKIEIKNRWTNACIYSCEVPDDAEQPIRVAVEDANLRGVDLRDANLRGVDLRGANLRGVDLRDANLHGVDLRDANLHAADLRDSDLHAADLRDSDLHAADLHGANLHAADLHGANLRDVDLHGANLRDANLHDVDLHGANLRGVDLHGANLHGADLHDGLRFAEFVKDVVPALLIAGGKPLAEVANEKVWTCHTWNNCPIHTAFGVEGVHQVPPVWRQHAARFVQFFDAGLIPLKDVLGAKVTR